MCLRFEGVVSGYFELHVLEECLSCCYVGLPYRHIPGTQSKVGERRRERRGLEIDIAVIACVVT